MKPIKNFILLVDSHKPIKYTHITAGRYRVGAKNEKEAIELLRKEIGFGSIQVYCEAKDVTISHKTVVKEIGEIIDGKLAYRFENPTHALTKRI